MNINKNSLLADVEYEDYDKNMAILDKSELIDLGLMKSCCKTKKKNKYPITLKK
ncbi:MAG: hypothetical protein ACRC41_08790 [Sarcina sp.]